MLDGPEIPISPSGGAGSADFHQDESVGRSSSEAEMDEALEALVRHKDEWARMEVGERAALLDRVSRDLAGLGDRWAAASIAGKGVRETGTGVAEEWGAFAVMLQLVRLLRRSLGDIEGHGRPRLPGRVRTLANGQVVVPVFPSDLYDRLLYRGISAEVWLRPDVGPEALYADHAARHREPPAEGRVTLVLGAGNFSNLGPGDLLHAMFGELKVVVYKSNPVNDYLSPLIEEGFRSLIERGFLRVVYGGAKVGAYLAQHPRVDDLHLTGSDKTHDAIVFGPGPDGAARKRDRNPRNHKPFTCELGNVSPLIVVPGPWSPADLAYQAEHIASTLTMNAGFNCLSTRVVIQHAGWEHREAILAGIREVLSGVPPRRAYYPAADRIHARFLAAHPEAECYGDPGDGELPWTFIPKVDPSDPQDICFTTEAFCSLFSETGLAATGAAEFLDEAVRFANERLWGSLTATLLVHPDSLRDPEVAAAVERAVANLRYGTVGVNQWGAMAFLMGTPAWGAFPGHPAHDIQSGTGSVNNTYLIPHVQKSVVRGPFRQWPKPVSFISHARVEPLFKQLAAFQARPAPWRLAGIVWNALRG
jgi:acyl-CoA reductase-like NAD-dependent aldehyde dehydrogenase